jgi:hypothetical protein
MTSSARHADCQAGILRTTIFRQLATNLYFTQNPPKRRIEGAHLRYRLLTTIDKSAAKRAVCGVLMSMSTSVSLMTVLLLTFATVATAQKPLATAQRYDDADAYEVYSLLLPGEESYTFAKDALMIQENTVAEDMFPVGPCLRSEDAKIFRAAIAGYNSIYKTKWLLQRKFQITKPYRIVNAKIISALPDQPQSAVSYVRLSPVGFNREKTQAVVFVESSCGGLCGSWQFHFLAKVHRKWNEVPVAGCGGAS